MAPEQAEGQEVDRRADVWAFGVLLYELLTGQQLFRGNSAMSTLAAVLSEEPGLEKGPAGVRRLLRACLRKDPRERLSNIGDWRLLLDGDSTTPQWLARAQRVPWALAVAGVALGVFGLWRFTSVPAQSGGPHHTGRLPGNAWSFPILLKWRAERRSPVYFIGGPVVRHLGGLFEVINMVYCIPTWTTLQVPACWSNKYKDCRFWPRKTLLNICARRTILADPCLRRPSRTIAR